MKIFDCTTLLLRRRGGGKGKGGSIQRGTVFQAEIARRRSEGERREEIETGKE